MSASDDSELLRVLRERQKTEVGEGGVDPEHVRDEWTAAVLDLLSTVEEWLAEARAEGLVKLTREPVRLWEDRLGEYETEQLRIRLAPDDIVLLKPIGRIIVGATGRMDLVAGPRNIMLVRERDGWKRVPSGRRITKTPLDKAGLEEALVELTSRG